MRERARTLLLLLTRRQIDGNLSESLRWSSGARARLRAFFDSDLVGASV